jgi:hypothetical protein
LAVRAREYRRGESHGVPDHDEPSAFDSAASTKLRGVPAGVQDSARRQQPWVTAPQQPQADGLSILTRLSNIDKHRTLTTVASAVGPATLGHSDRVSIDDWEHGTYSLLGPGRNRVGSFVGHSAEPFDDGDVTSMYGYKVHLEGYYFGVMVGFVRRVFQALWDVENGAPAGPVAPYPWLDPVSNRYVRLGA